MKEFVTGNVYFYTVAEHVADDSSHIDAEHGAHNSCHIDPETSPQLVSL